MPAVQDPAVLAKYGFLYSGYSARHPYWETTEMLRKFAIAFIPVRGAVEGGRGAEGRGDGGGGGSGQQPRRPQHLSGAACILLAPVIPPSGPSPQPAVLASFAGQVFIPAEVDGSLQAAVAQVVLLVYIILTLRLWPFAASADNWLQLASLLGGWVGDVEGGQVALSAA